MKNRVINRPYQNATHSQVAHVQRRRASANADRALRFEEAMFERRSRHLILILTLNYKPEYRETTTLDDLRTDRDNFFNNMRSNPLLQAISGLIWKLEQGHNRGGHHMHVVIFYSGDCRADVYYANCIGEYWEHVITKGRGTFWNSNAHRQDFRWGWGDATGQIDRHDARKRESFRLYLEHYIAKEDQQVLSRDNPHCRMFGTSRLPIDA